MSESMMMQPNDAGSRERMLQAIRESRESVLFICREPTRKFLISNKSLAMLFEHHTAELERAALADREHELFAIWHKERDMFVNKLIDELKRSPLVLVDGEQLPICSEGVAATLLACPPKPNW